MRGGKKQTQKNQSLLERTPNFANVVLECGLPEADALLVCLLNPKVAQSMARNREARTHRLTRVNGRSPSGPSQQRWHPHVKAAQEGRNKGCLQSDEESPGGGGHEVSQGL